MLFDFNRQMLLLCSALVQTTITYHWGDTGFCRGRMISMFPLLLSSNQRKSIFKGINLLPFCNRVGSLLLHLIKSRLLTMAPKILPWSQCCLSTVLSCSTSVSLPAQPQKLLGLESLKCTTLLSSGAWYTPLLCSSQHWLLINQDSTESHFTAKSFPSLFF